MKKLMLTLLIIAGFFITSDAQRTRQATTVRPVQSTERRHVRVEERRRHRIARKLRKQRHRTAFEIIQHPQYMIINRTGLVA